MKGKRVQLALVLGSGGHTSELIKIISNLPISVDDTNSTKPFDSSFSPVKPANHLLIYSEGDALSVSKYQNEFGVEAGVVKRIPRARRVGQSYFTSIFTTIYSFIASIFILFQFNPKLVKHFRMPNAVVTTNFPVDHL